MAASTHDATGKLILRLAVGVIVLLHGIAKVRGGIDPIVGMVTAAGLPGALAYGVYAGELVGPVLLILGLYARIGAALIAINMLVALALVHRADILALGPQGGWAIELQALMLFGAIAAMLLGPGRPSINGR